MSRKNHCRCRDGNIEQLSAKPSRSALKRRSLALQDMGEQLTRLSPEVLADIGLPHALEDAVRRYVHTHGHEAKRRQMQYIGRLMREVDEITLEKLIWSGIPRQCHQQD
ncbi:MAG: DUF615 domain-containing protein [Desulfovibrio sp.]|jgi:ribosome-associated protein|nr:DUF615 domain-containing protein [Desulfovibrio sp.]